ncbi:hypothetical protein AAV94_08330 [Lampropedia cohaerens]|uniref:Trehalose 6-phosphate phosphatase n=1 Tax=Lampropedia cohaerens TaxID=1610491 RepID=A0A0U1PZ75_9BURK|nr:trehalose-phosphatase [Lampropedia cohaerens]KKW67655.1 hypothetical protein AAV94_08330 [Lampropedia cohaerens]
MPSTHAQAPPPRLELPLTRYAWFFDFDGTLAELQARPDRVSLPAARKGLLRRLQAASGGAVAILTGRSLEDLQPLIAPLRLPCAGMHGLQLHIADRTRMAATARLPYTVLARLQDLAECHPGVLLENKGECAAALHYRQAPHHASALEAAMQALLPTCNGYELLHGKCVLELRPASASKGTALRLLMRNTPFKDRIPLCVGDDRTDEDGFAAAQALGGIGIKIGTGATQGQWRLADPSALQHWLHQQLEAATHAAAPVSATAAPPASTI